MDVHKQEVLLRDPEAEVELAPNGQYIVLVYRPALKQHIVLGSGKTEEEAWTRACEFHKSFSEVGEK